MAGRSVFRWDPVPKTKAQQHFTHSVSCGKPKPTQQKWLWSCPFKCLTQSARPSPSSWIVVTAAIMSHQLPAMDLYNCIIIHTKFQANNYTNLCVLSFYCSSRGEGETQSWHWLALKRCRYISDQLYPHFDYWVRIVKDATSKHNFRA
jgi:hypothetical protein